MTPFEISPANRRFLKFEGEFIECATDDDAQRLCNQLNRLMAKRDCVHHSSHAQRIVLDTTQVDQLIYWFGDQGTIVVSQHQQRDRQTITSAHPLREPDHAVIVLEPDTPYPFIRSRDDSQI